MSGEACCWIGRRPPRDRYTTAADFFMTDSLLKFLAMLGLVLSASTLRSQDLQDPKTPTSQVAQLLVRRCVSCHHARKAEGELNLESMGGLIASRGGLGPVVERQSVDDSPILQRLTSTDPDLQMPPEGERCSEEEIDLLRQWIVAGTPWEIDASTPLWKLCPDTPYLAEPPHHYAQPLPVAAIASDAERGRVWLAGYHEILAIDPRDGKLVQRVGKLGQQTSAIAVDPATGAVFVACGTPGERGFVYRIDPDQTIPPRRLALANDVPSDIALSPEGKEVAIAHRDGRLEVRRCEDGSLVLDATPHADAILSVTWSPDGKRLLCTSRDRTAKSWDRQEKEWIAAYDRHDRAVGGGTFLGKRPCTYDDAGVLRCWPADHGESIDARRDGMHRHLMRLASNKDLLLVTEASRLRLMRIGTREEDDGKDDQGKAKKKRRSIFEELAVLEAPEGTRLTSACFLDDRSVAAGTAWGDLLVWRWESDLVVLPVSPRIEPTGRWSAYPRPDP
ncbi:MAG: c-type cytochrome domain-containing protein [Pirellulaceae bacterium]|jgi:mono/diheme cytochrome c family protein